MSWQAYIDQLEGAPNNIPHAMIVGKNGSLWAKSTKTDIFNPEASDLMVGIKALLNQDTSIMGVGLTAGGIKFTCIKMEQEVLIAKGKEAHKDACLVFSLSEQAAVIGFSPSGDCKPPQIVTNMASTITYLKSTGY